MQVLDLQNGSNRLSEQYGGFLTVGSGIVSNGSIVDTGNGDGADFVIGLNSEKVDDLLDSAGSSSFRRIVRTGWLEKE